MKLTPEHLTLAYYEEFKQRIAEHKRMWLEAYDAR